MSSLSVREARLRQSDGLTVVDELAGRRAEAQRLPMGAIAIKRAVDRHSTQAREPETPEEIAIGQNRKRLVEQAGTFERRIETAL